jgi:hypothetical protein
MKYPDFIEQLIVEKEYNQLTPTEKQQVMEWVDSETEYTAIRQLLAGIDAATEGEAEFIPSAGIKTDLQAAFNKKHNKPAGLKFTRNWVVISSVAASLLLVALSVWVFNRDEKQVVSKVDVPQTEKDVIIENPPPITAKTETITPLITNEPTPQPENNNNNVLPEAVDNTNSIAIATYPDLNELMITVF